MSVKFDQEIDRYMARQAAHKAHDSCRGAGDPDYHQPEDYMDAANPQEVVDEPKQPDEYADLS